MLKQAPGRTCGPVERETYARAGLLTALETRGGPTLEQPVPEGLHPVEGNHSGAVCEELQPMEGLMLAKFVENSLPWEEPSSWSKGRVLGVLPLRRKERQRQRGMNGPQPPLPVPLHRSGGGGRETGVKLSPGRREGWGGRCFKIWFYFLLSYSDLIGYELNSLFCPSSVCVVCDSNWSVISPCCCLDPRAFQHIFLPLSS